MPGDKGSKIVDFTQKLKDKRIKKRAEAGLPEINEREIAPKLAALKIEAKRVQKELALYKPENIDHGLHIVTRRSLDQLLGTNDGVKGSIAELYDSYNSSAYAWNDKYNMTNIEVLVFALKALENTIQKWDKFYANIKPNEKAESQENN